MSLRRLLFVALLINGGRAAAHVGANPSKATLLNPPAPTALPTDGGLVLAPFTFSNADQSFDVEWSVDFPTDPTGRFSFFYLDHMPPSAVIYDEIVVLASPIPEASGDKSYWVSCNCANDLGVVCPDAGPRDPYCGKLSFTWDTSGIPTGVYWIIAANNDPPYKIYSVSQAPVRISHAAGVSPPPAVTIVLPDGLFATDTSYTTQWLATGVPPLHFDVFFGVNDVSVVMNAPTSLGMDISPIKNADGSFSFIWDTSMLTDGLYYFGVKVTDATGQSSFTDSQLGENVYHPPQDGGIVVVGQDLAVPHDGGSPDLTIVLKNDGSGGCKCDLGAGNQAAPLAAGLFAALALTLALRRRKRT